MRILVLGGTAFLGRHFVEATLSRGHALTLFNRGITAPGLFSGAEQIHGNRDGGLAALSGRTFDAVVDTSGYLPRVVRQSTDAFSGATGQYLFVSSISIYADVSRIGITEEEATLALSQPDSEDINKDYGALKFLCEEIVRERYGERALIVRPGLIVGPHDRSDRFTYWPHRIAQGGDVLVPGRPDRRIQFIDVRDLAAWMLRMVEEGRCGTFNADGPEMPCTMGDLMDTCLEVCASGARLHYVPDAFLKQQGVGEWLEMPLWVEEKPEVAGFFEVDCSRAIATGLSFRSVPETVRDTLAWDRGREGYVYEKTGLAAEREQHLLDAFARNGGSLGGSPITRP